jgi:peptidyl-prolyl cis-trans isomerase SDCCAG10
VNPSLRLPRLRNLRRSRRAQISPKSVKAMPRNKLLGGNSSVSLSCFLIDSPTYSDSRRAEIEKVESEIRRLAKKRDGDLSDDEPKKKTKKSYLEEELAKYSKGRGLQKKGKDGKRKDEGDVLAALNSFRGKLQKSMLVDEEPEEEGAGEGGGEGAGGDVAGMEVDDDRGFMGHALHFPKDNGEETQKAERDYEVIDPRARGARAKEEERERKNAALKAKGGGVRGGRYRR